MLIVADSGRTVAFASSRNGGQLDVYQRPSNASGADEPLLRTALRTVRDVARTWFDETGTVALADEVAQPAG